MDEPADEVLEVMPWAFFRHMTTSDLHAIYEYCDRFRMLNMEHAVVRVNRIWNHGLHGKHGIIEK